jgi:UDP-N-acetylglucosamine 4,6-dehydratase
MDFQLAAKRILIIGGTGSLGKALVKRLLADGNDTEIFLYSRDECKHWDLALEYSAARERVRFVLGDVSDAAQVGRTLAAHDFHLVILAAAMKHIEKCELDAHSCIRTNLLGTKTVLDEIERNADRLASLEAVCFISTDKACSPVNVYGMCKAVSEALIVEKAVSMKNRSPVRFVAVRYGNVLNSRGSIIPTLHRIGASRQNGDFVLTDPRMTRYIMTLDQSVDLVLYALRSAESGDVVVPELVACNIADLFSIFGELYEKGVVVGKVRPGEKMCEAMINASQATRMTKGVESKYRHIKPFCWEGIPDCEVGEYTSDNARRLTREELMRYLAELRLLERPLAAVD